MQDKIKQILSQYQGQTIEFAMNFEKSGGTLIQQIEKLFEEETKLTIRKEKEKYINELEQMVLVWNNQVLLSKLTVMRDRLEEK